MIHGALSISNDLNKKRKKEARWNWKKIYNNKYFEFSIVKQPTPSRSSFHLGDNVTWEQHWGNKWHQKNEESWAKITLKIKIHHISIFYLLVNSQARLILWVVDYTFERTLLLKQDRNVRYSIYIINLDQDSWHSFSR